MPTLAPLGRRTDQRQRPSLPGTSGSGRRRRSRWQREKFCAQQFARAIQAELERFVGPGCADQLDFEALESYLRGKALEFAGQLLAQRLNQDANDTTGDQRISCLVPFPCLPGSRQPPKIHKPTPSGALLE